MGARAKNAFLRIGSFALAGGLLYLALRGVDFERVGQDLRQANYWWLIPIVVVTLGSHWLRAWRWTFLLDEIRDDRERAKPVATKGAFAALMIGYLANYAAPRLGEVVRTANIASRYHHRFASVFGTVVTERVLDVATMALAMLTIPLIFSGQLSRLTELLMEPVRDAVPSIPGWAIVAVLVLGGLVLLGMVRFLRSDRASKLRSIVFSFAGGLLTILRTPRRVELVISTIVMWGAYGLMAYLPFVMFGFQATYGVSLLDAWAIMLIGAIGVVIPAPAGFGSYHYITIQTLVLLFAFSQEAAASYAILTHTGQLLIYVVTGAFFILGMGFTLRTSDTENPSE